MAEAVISKAETEDLTTEIRETEDLLTTEVREDLPEIMKDVHSEMTVREDLQEIIRETEDLITETRETEDLPTTEVREDRMEITVSAADVPDSVREQEEEMTVTQYLRRN